MKRLNNLTVKQKMVLEAIEYFINNNHYSPTIRELAELLNSDPHAVFEKLMQLERKGYISTANGKARTIKILKKVEE